MMTGREIIKMAFDLEEAPRTPVTLIGGGAWLVHLAGQTFAGIKQDPEKIADVFIQGFQKVGHDLFWTGSNFINYPIHFLGCTIEDNSSDGPHPASRGAVSSSGAHSQLEQEVGGADPGRTGAGNHQSDLLSALSLHLQRIEKRRRDLMRLHDVVELTRTDDVQSFVRDYFDLRATRI